MAALAILTSCINLQAQISFTTSIVIGDGTLSWAATPFTGRCGYQGQTNYVEWVYSGFTYLSNSVVYILSGSPIYYSSPGGACPPSGGQPSMLQPGGRVPVNGESIYSVDFYPSSGGHGSGSLVQTGYISDPQ